MNKSFLLLALVAVGCSQNPPVFEDATPYSVSERYGCEFLEDFSEFEDCIEEALEHENIGIYIHYAAMAWPHQQSCL